MDASASTPSRPQPAAALTPFWVVVGLAMGPLVTLGLARFAYALLLPPMRTALDWSFTDAGAMNAANAAGYLAGALVATPIGRWLGGKRTFALGLLVTDAALVLCGLTTEFTLLLLLRLLAGFTGALAFVLGATLATAAAAGGSPARAPTLLGVYVAGSGLGIIASALAVPPLLDGIGWRGGWLALGGLGLVASVYGWLVLGRTPVPPAAVDGARGGWSLRFMACELAAYTLFGAGYIAYITFIIAFLRHDRDFSSSGVTLFWAVLGLASIIAAFAWGSILGRLKGGWGTTVTTSVLAVGAALPLLWPTPAGAYASAVLFGGSFLAVVTAVTSFARRAAKPHAWTAAIAALTIAFGLGQCIGPVLSGALSDGPGGVRIGLWLSVGILAAAAMVAAFQPEPRPDR